MNPANYEQLDAGGLEQISHDLLQEIATHNGRLSGSLRSRLERLPRHIRKELVEREHEGCSSLFIACREGKLQIARYLVGECDASLNQRGVLIYPFSDELGDNKVHNVTLLCCACDRGHLQIVKYLVSLGCDVNGISDNGSTPLEKACIKKDLHVVQFLLENGADIQKPGSLGVNYLMDSVGSVQLCSYLISKGADVNQRNVYESTALHYAVQKKCLCSTQLLLDHGADPFAKNCAGSDALQIASIRGSVDVVYYLIDRIGYPKETWITALELLGSTLVHNNYVASDVVEQWQKTIVARGDPTANNHIQRKSQVVRRSAYRNAIEITTLAELNAIAQDVDALRMQGLIIQERILKIYNGDVLSRLMQRGFLYIQTRQFQMCIDQWLLTLSVRAPLRSILDNKTCETAQGLVKLMVTLFDIHEPEMPRFEDVYNVFQLLTSKINKAQQLLSVPPVQKVHQLNYNCILKCLTHLMYLLLSIAKDENDHLLIKNSVRQLVRNKIRCGISKATLLHLSVSSSNVVKSKYMPGRTETKKIFPNLQVTKLLLECGANVNACDDTRSTPLLLVSLPDNYNKELVSTLVEHGAHLDMPNLSGDRPSSLLMKNTANDIPVNNFMSLQCISANFIAASDIPYQNEVPRVMEDFIQAHHIP